MKRMNEKERKNQTRKQFKKERFKENWLFFLSLIRIKNLMSL